MSDTWTIGELAAHAARALRAATPPQAANGRVRDVPGERLIRWYTTIGLVDPPLTRRGRVARYGRRHLLQLVAVKRLQAAGQSIAQIQTALTGATDRMLEAAAQLSTADLIPAETPLMDPPLSPSHPPSATAPGNAAAPPAHTAHGLTTAAHDAMEGDATHDGVPPVTSTAPGGLRADHAGPDGSRTDDGGPDELRAADGGPSEVRAQGGGPDGLRAGGDGPDSLRADGGGPDAGGSVRGRFWAERPRESAVSPRMPAAAPGAPVPAPGTRSGKAPGRGGAVVSGVWLADGVRLVLDAGRVPSEEDVQAVLAAAGPLLAVLEERELI
ncbi:helix-turn-helix domain-containing protein [Nonomuraea jiangxiensis]|uniref:MerR HTH family regulatory protein n=1 Tax=Nonomuraea jiangxiensis TaxID=633440 RepID=A0A1G8H552_9ACTN|nr:helix-turn-helix domain-containing protein [Nonomuraea jiangxiensis]SDI01699.1 MerR HTH family regulatory protein [Nonomuraea jiangxiensis]